MALKAPSLPDPRWLHAIVTPIISWLYMEPLSYWEIWGPIYFLYTPSVALYFCSQSEHPLHSTRYSNTIYFITKNIYFINIKHIKNIAGYKNKINLISKSARSYFLVGGDWRCTSFLSFGLRLSTYSATSTLGNFWQSCRLRWFCYIPCTIP